MLFFLTKHPNGDFYVMPVMSPPLDVKSEAGKKELEAVKKLTETMADPMKGLKSDKPAVRAETAAIMVMKYRSYPEFAREVEQVAINAEESKLILQALTEGEWTAERPAGPGRGRHAQRVHGVPQSRTDRTGWLDATGRPQGSARPASDRTSPRSRRKPSATGSPAPARNSSSRSLSPRSRSDNSPLPTGLRRLGLDASTSSVTITSVEPNRAGPRPIP